MIRDAEASDVVDIAALAQKRRQQYERVQPQFWRQSRNATDIHRPWLQGLIERSDTLGLVLVDPDGGLAGYLFASVVESPPVYDPGGSTGLIDDFYVSDTDSWATSGIALLQEAKIRLQSRGVAQIVVVAGHHDAHKRAALLDEGLSVATEWYVQTLDRPE